MSLSFALAIYFVVWWITLFAVLPLGLRTQGEEGVVVPGTPESAPAKPRLLWLALVNTGVSLAVFAIIWVFVTYRLLGGDVVLPPLPKPGP